MEKVCMSATETHATLGIIPKAPRQIVEQPLANFEADKAALQALVQAAVNVELFTVPLYMCTMKSIQGTHAINANGISYYKGRRWPGMATGTIPLGAPPEKTAPQRAYNLLFSVFIDEMLHLQMAANLCGAVGVTPTFNSPLLQDANYNWICYGPTQTVIPHIIDLQDLEDGTVGSGLNVDLAGLTDAQVALFTVIEENHDTARVKIKPSVLETTYFPTVPFNGWIATNTEVDLPKFGTIGWMYFCLFQYITLKYEDNQTLWEKVFTGPTGQRDLFNTATSKIQKEYPQLNTQITETHPLAAAAQAIYMMYAICDQGEGGIDWQTTSAFLGMIHERALETGAELATLNSVIVQFQPDEAALANNYPSYTDSGDPAPSADAAARSSNGGQDHYERFEQLLDLVDQVETWSEWHAVSGNIWTEALLTSADFDPATAPTSIPKPSEVATALNNLKLLNPVDLDNVAQGSLAGITTVLTKSWGDLSVDFPFPSMVGSGDRMGLYWAVYGSAPTLRQGMAAQPTSALQHACQGLALDGSGGNCAAPAIYHSCKGSNTCATQGGCGFAHGVSGGGNCSQAIGGRGGCGQSAPRAPAVGGTCGLPDFFSAPADNKCAGLGGCAVPISASQLYPTAGTMELFNFTGSDNTPTPIAELPFAVGDSVYDIAWQAFEKVMANRQLPPGIKPSPTDLRIALPPST